MLQCERDVGLGEGDRAFDVEALRDAGCDRGCERAAGAMCGRRADADGCVFAEAVTIVKSQKIAPSPISTSLPMTAVGAITLPNLEQCAASSLRAA